MLNDLRQWLSRLPGLGRLHAERMTLSALLAGVNIGLVILVIVGISWSAIDRLRDLAEDQGRARVQVSAATVRDDIRQEADDVVRDARELAERPTVVRLVRDRRQRSLQTLLKRYCQSNAFDACAVVIPGQKPVVAGDALPWDEILDAADEQGERILIAPLEGGDPVLAGAVSVAAANETAMETAPRVILVKALDAGAAKAFGQRAGSAVRILNYNTFADENVDAFTPLHTAALATGQLTGARLGPQELFVASYPLFAPTGEAVALIETRLPISTVEATVGSLIRRLLAFALTLGVIAGAIGILLGRRVADPVRALTEAATRLGQGDFSTSIPARGPAEVGTLARTMEDMRRSLLDLTGALRRREAERQAVLDGVVEGVYAVDRERRIRYLNPRALELLGVSAEDAIGRFCGDVLKPHTENGVRPCENNCPIVHARMAGSARATERLSPTAGPARTTVITSSSAVDDLQVQVIRDETELEGVRRARDSVLANISHEFRTPLAAQLASIELLRDGLDTLEPDARRDLVLSLERGTVRLTRLIDNLLESVRIESGQLGLRRQPVSIADVVELARGLVGALIVQRRQALVVEIPDDLPALEGDVHRLTQVFVNLLANASKFAPEGTTIRIGARRSGNEIETWVEDEGPGVPEGTGDSIFDRFHRAGPDEPEPTGLGLGLWIVRSIVERHGGRVSARRTPEARTRFQVDLPLQPLE